ncbi:MAG: SseB family protein [Pseudomonadota bacterium]
MTELDKVIQTAYATTGRQEDVNKVYLALLRSLLFVPVEKNSVIVNEEEPFRPLFANIEGNYFMLVFDSNERLAEWAGEHYDAMQYVEISGRDVISGVGEQVFVGLNAGTEFYKEFSPDEVKRLKTIVARIDQLRPQT